MGRGVRTDVSMVAGLDRTVVGDYLGDHREFEKKVRNAFVEMIDFRGMTFDEGTWSLALCCCCPLTHRR